MKKQWKPVKNVFVARFYTSVSVEKWTVVIRRIDNSNVIETIKARLWQSRLINHLRIFWWLTGDWILIVVHLFKHIEHNNLNGTAPQLTAWPDNKNGSLLYFITVSALGSYTLYFGIGGFLHVNQFDFEFNCIAMYAVWHFTDKWHTVTTLLSNIYFIQVVLLRAAARQKPRMEMSAE